jgi:hypothetical protein
VPAVSTTRTRSGPTQPHGTTQTATLPTPQRQGACAVQNSSRPVIVENTTGPGPNVGRLTPGSCAQIRRGRRTRSTPPGIAPNEFPPGTTTTDTKSAVSPQNTTPERVTWPPDSAGWQPSRIAWCLSSVQVAVASGAVRAMVSATQLTVASQEQRYELMIPGQPACPRLGCGPSHRATGMAGRARLQVRSVLTCQSGRIARS